MPQNRSRRRLFADAGCLASGLAASALLPALPRAARAGSAAQLIVQTRALEVNGRAATVLGVAQPDGTAGLTLEPGQRFAVSLANRLDQDTIIHWHGQTPPNDQDGVAILDVEKLIGPGASASYDFAPRPGTHWMHSHQGLQEMQLLAAPLIVRSAEDRTRDAQEVVMILHDFTFRSPREVLAGLAAAPGMTMPGMGMAETAMKPMQGAAAPGPDLNDVAFDAFLANERTLADPQVVRTERGGSVHLRIINAAAATAFWIDLGAAIGTLIAVDGSPVRPVPHQRLLPLAEAQRLDILLRVPPGAAVPVLAQRQGDRARTGLVLAAPGAAVARVAAQAREAAAPVLATLERSLTAAQGLRPRPVDRRYRVELSGSMHPYAWRINGRAFADRVPLQVAKGERVRFDLVNMTPMAHPMHLHGHVFQVIAIGNQPMQGAIRDTVQVPPRSTLSIAFDADNPGRWLFHCHNLLHMETGMMTEVAYV